MKRCSTFAVCSSVLLASAVLSAPSTARADVLRVGSMDEALRLPDTGPGPAIFRIRFDLPLDGGRIADTELTFTVPALVRGRAVYLVPGSIGPLEFYDSDVPGFDAGEILAQAGYVAATSNLPGVGRSSGPANGRDVDAAFLGDFYLRALEALTWVTPRWHVYGEEGTGGNAVLLLARHPEIVRSASGGAQVYKILTPIGAAALLGPQQLAFLDAFPNGYLFPPPALYTPFFASSTPAFQTAACGGVGCPGPGGFLLTDAPYPSGIFFDAIAAFSPGGTGVVVDASPAVVPGFFQQGQFDFLAASPQDSGQLAADYGTTGGGHATSAIDAGGFHFVRTDAATGDGATSPFWVNELAFLESN
jgi:hypothetical protein